MAKTIFPDSMMDELPRDKDGRIELHVISGVGEMTGEVPAAFGSDHEPAEQTSADDRPGMSGEHSRLPANQQYLVDFPAAPSLTNIDGYTWDENKPPVENYAGIGESLAQAGDLFRSPTYAGGLILASQHPNVPSTPVNDPESLRAVILDRLRVNVVSRGKPRDGTIRAVHLRTMLKSEAFLQQFRAVDEVIDRPMYLEPDFRLTSPGYNDGGYGRRYLHVGTAAVVADGREAIDRFLDVMDFESDADRVNAIAAGLTVLLRNLWPGGKPIVVVTANKSHAGKETIISFAGGATPTVGLSYTEADWALERNFVAAVGKDRKIGLVNIDNARLGKHRNIRSAFLERYLTDPKPFLFSTGTGRPVRRMNTIVVSMSTNHGSLVEDLMNRSLPIRLALSGDVIDRRSPIGNPKLQYLPANRECIEAEFHGMIGRWVAQAMPLARMLHECFRTPRRADG